MSNILIRFKCAKCAKIATNEVTGGYEAARLGLLIGLNKLFCDECLMGMSLDEVSALVDDLPLMEVTGDIW